MTNKETKEPIAGVSVTVQGTAYGSITKDNGTYTILGVPPGTYTVVARRVGHGQVTINNVVVSIDVKRPLDIQMSSTGTLAAQNVEAPPVPIIEQGAVGSNIAITNEQIAALPVTSIGEVLALQQGYQEVPQNTNLISLAEERRNTTAPVRTRNSRGGATVTLVDGTPVNNPITGTQAITLNPMAAGGVNFGLGYMEPSYGGGLSGIINSSVREGGERFQGGLQYTTSAIAGALGSDPDKLNAQHIFNGFVSGPVPGTANKLRYSVSGQISNSANTVLKFDNDVFRWNTAPIQAPGEAMAGVGQPLAQDLIQGWRAFGGRSQNQIVGKLTFQPTSSLKLTLTSVGQTRQTMTYDRNYQLTYGGDPWSVVNTLMDSLGLNGGNRNYWLIVQGSVRDQSNLNTLQLEKSGARSHLRLSVGRTALKRLTCNVFQGVCMTTRFWTGNFNAAFIAPFTGAGEPFPGGDVFYGGEDYKTYTSRADYELQATDHHRITIGATFTQHDIFYNDAQGLGTNSGAATPFYDVFRAKPIEAASYLQDNIEYAFLTINAGLRYDYGVAKGKGFANPLDPTNGTSAREVCNGTAKGINTTPFTYGGQSGVLACLSSPPGSNGRAVLLDSATKLAQKDDFREAKPRTGFSPRLGLSFPLTEQSQLFFNAGRYTKNPEYLNVYQYSGVGTVAGPSDNFCAANAVKPGTTECHPPLVFNLPSYIGNPNLLLEQATSYEVGFQANLGRLYAMSVSVWNRDESGLSGPRLNNSIQDIGATYNSNSLPNYRILVNQDFATVRGIDVGFRRQQGRGSIWGYNINYGWSRATENQPPPDRSVEAAISNELNQNNTRTEQLSASDRGSNFNATVTLSYGQTNVPKFRGGGVLKNTTIGLTYNWAQGTPYTPTKSTTYSGVISTVAASDINTGRGPSTQSANLRYAKQLALGNARYGLQIDVQNIFNIQNCIQVYNNTGTCNSGVREFNQRRVGNSSGTSSTNFDQPEYHSDGRRIRTGITVNF